MPEFLKFIGPRGQKIMRSANNVGNAGPHVRQTFLNDVFTFETEVGIILRITIYSNTGIFIFMTVTNNIYQKQIKYHIFNAVTNSELNELVPIWCMV
jgi:hypothetical protein